MISIFFLVLSGPGLPSLVKHIFRAGTFSCHCIFENLTLHKGWFNVKSLKSEACPYERSDFTTLFVQARPDMS